jgi:polyphosphate:AMP phosphotransferase
MFESAEIGHEIAKEEYEQREPELRTALLKAQYEMLEKKKFSVVVVVGGVDGAGKGDTINQLNSWLDARHVRTHGMGKPTDEEAARPEYWRFWRHLPGKGEIGMFMGSWYTMPILDRTFRRTRTAELDSAMDRARHYERMLCEEDVILLKLWFHLSKREQRERLERLEDDKRLRWRVTAEDWKHFGLYDRFHRVSARALRQSSTEYAPWLVVSGRDRRYRELAVGSALLSAIQRGLARSSEPAPPPIAPIAPPAVDGKRLLDTLDLGAKLEKEEYETKLEKLQGKLNLQTRSPKFARRSLLVVFEGADAAGKGSAIRRVTAALDARQYAVVPIAAPTDEERARPYLWRFWRHLPARGKIVFFDRSWYGRVLVERVEGFAPHADWARAYTEINDFEEQLVENGTVLVKLWLQVDQDEQLRRFQERERTGFKQHKITDEDWRNREKWGAYRIATNDMIERTSTEIAPWTLVAANDKRFARIKVLETITNALARAV